MKYLMLTLLFVISLLQAEGFGVDTLIHIECGLVPIQQVRGGDYVIVNCGNQSPIYAVTNIKTRLMNCYIKITMQDVVLCLASNQKLYVLGKGWMRADELVLSDLLLCCNKKLVAINAFTVIHEQQKMHTLSVEESHLFCVTKYGIIVHNVEPVGTGVATAISFACPPLGAAIFIGELVTLGVAGFAAYLIHKKAKKEDQHNRYPTYSGGTNNCPCGGKPPKHEDDKDEHPHGTYEDAGYHHQNCRGNKSNSPKNGQKCLDKSLPSENASEQRISMEGDTFVVLRKTAYRKFHGYCVKWDKLHWSFQQALIDSGAVRQTGKIVKDVAHRIFK
jgi:hypothetical protein